MTAEARRLTLLAALTLPLRACRDDAPLSAKQRLSAPAHIILNALKWKRRDAECVAVLHEAVPKLLQCCQQLQGAPGLSGGQTEDNEMLRVELGRTLRQLGKQGLVMPGLVLAPLLTLPEALPLGVDSAVAQEEATEASPPSPTPAVSSTPEAREEIFRTLHSAVEAFGLQNCWKAKPLLTGKEVMAMLGIQGKLVGKVLEQISDWQLAHPNASAPQCKEWLQASKDSVLAQAQAKVALEEQAA
ncbi:hypothetical protein CVIRNUC_007676 [Coccomyxa viridis]|uniref:Uncharacterized protein n=1 Tax=Coccomyxa viridis TaxID=1274662 RepID=A0AAV1IBJ0_9CHLO|nr:hypothetical protein CVIRNUC_007676 [Coccomyxa viridis]